MASKAEVDAWTDLEQLSLNDQSRSTHRSGNAGDYDHTRQFRGDADKPSTTESNRNDASEEGSIDIAIRQALMDPKERTTVLKIEDQVEKFIQDGSREELEFPNNFSNYQRMLAHRVSQYYGLQTSVKDGFQEGPGRVVAKKTEHMRVPQTKLGELKSALHTRAADRTAPKVLQRRPAGNETVKSAHSSNPSTPSPAVSMKAREEEYNEARERIGLGKAVDNSSTGGKTQQLTSKPNANGAARSVVSNGPRNAQRKAVIRDKEKDLQDPDYRRGLNRFSSRYEGFPVAQTPAMYSMPGGAFPNEAPGSKTPVSPTSSTNSHPFRSEMGPWGSNSASGFRPPPPPPPQPSANPKGFLPSNGQPHPVAPMARPMVAYTPYPAMPGMHFSPGMAMPHPGMSPQGMYAHPNMPMAAYPMVPGYAFMPPGQEGMPIPAIHMYPGFNPASYHTFPAGAHPAMPRAPMPMGMHMMMGMPGHFHMDLAHGMPGFGMDRGPGGHGRQHSNSGPSHAPSHVSIKQIEDSDSKSKNSNS